MRYVALLRAVNVGGRRLAMEDLRRALAKAGYDARTLSGNGSIVLDAPKTAASKLEASLEAAIASATGLVTDVMVRDAAGWRDMIDANPFPKEAKAAPNRLGVMVMKTRPDLAAANARLKAYSGPARAKFGACHVYIHYPDGYSILRLDPTHFGVGTVRNWNMMLQLAAMLEA